MKYNEYPIAIIKKIIRDGQMAAKNGWTEEEMFYRIDCSFAESRFLTIGFRNPDFIVGEIRTFYRIGEPAENGYGCYKPSYNYADDMPEDGVSVVTLAWLNSMKSVFFGTTDEKIQKRGVYKIRGFVLPRRGGDDEVLICPMDWAEKTRIRTRAGLEKAVKNTEKET